MKECISILKHFNGRFHATCRNVLRFFFTAGTQDRFARVFLSGRFPTSLFRDSPRTEKITSAIPHINKGPLNSYREHHRKYFHILKYFSLSLKGPTRCARNCKGFSFRLIPYPVVQIRPPLLKKLYHRTQVFLSRSKRSVPRAEIYFLQDCKGFYFW